MSALSDGAGNMERKECQLLTIEETADRLSKTALAYQLRFRLKRVLKRRWRYVINILSATIRPKAQNIESFANAKTQAPALQPGDIVMVRPADDIKSTLNHWNQFKGCAFMEEMWPLCGTTQRVLKRVERFLDERDYTVRKCRGILILEGVYCEGTMDFGDCDRTCFFFWREEWLEKVGHKDL
jgi:hypothetical protein